MRFGRRLLFAGPILAHQGGWDEILLVFGLPVALFVVMRLLAGCRRPDDDDEAD